jgi:threonine dehydrogenase-like Zn-dependent dehydrogenase
MPPPYAAATCTATHTSAGSPEHPFLYGHEGIGHVVEGDSAQSLSVGDYVVIPDNVNNGHFTLDPDTYIPSLGLGGVEGTALPGLQGEQCPRSINRSIPIDIDEVIANGWV